MAVVPPLNNFMGPEGDTVTVAEQLLNTEYMQGVCGGFGTRRPSNQESFSKMFLNTSSRVIRLRLILGISSAFYY